MTLTKQMLTLIHMYPAAEFEAKVVYKEPLFFDDYFFMTVFIITAFLLQGGQGRPPQNDFCPPPENAFAPKIKTIEKTIKTIAYCFKNNGLLSFVPLKFFLAESQYKSTDGG